MTPIRRATSAPARNAHPRLRLAAPPKNPGRGLRRDSRNATPRAPLAGYRHLVRQLWRPAA